MITDITFPFTEDQIKRYSRHILLKEIGGLGQQTIMRKSVLVGGSHTGSLFAAYYFAATGIQHMYIYPEIRDDKNSQSISGISINHAEWEKNILRLRDLNPDTDTRVISHDELHEYHYDYICNFFHDTETRSLVNKLSLKNRVHQCSVGFSSQHAYADFYAVDGSPCADCVQDFYSSDGQSGWQEVVHVAILPFFGSLITVEIIKIMLNIGKTQVGKRMRFHTGSGLMSAVRLSGKIGCRACQPVE